MFYEVGLRAATSPWMKTLLDTPYAAASSARILASSTFTWMLVMPRSCGVLNLEGAFSFGVSASCRFFSARVALMRAAA